MAVKGEAPAHWEGDVVLTDGGTAHVRPISPEDAHRLEAFHAGLSDETVRARFFGPITELAPEMVEHFTNVDHDDRVALVAELGDALIALASYERLLGTNTAEVAFVVADEQQDRGIGTILLEHLAVAARERRITSFVAETLQQNRRMLEVFRAAGFEERIRADGVDALRVELVIEPTERARAAVEAREHHAEAASVARLLTPRSVAVVGASRNPASVGHQVLHNLLAGGFDGPVYPVNPKAEWVASVKAYGLVTDVPGEIDLAVIAVPATSVLEVLHECAAKAVKAVVVLTAGFGEIGMTEAEATLRTVARRNGMRLVGPNCIGIVNTAVGLDATFSPDPPMRGRIAMQSQSGALGIVLLDRSARMGIGVSSFVSVGNKADVSGNDLLQYWEDDPNTDVILLYLESFGNPRKFARIARRVSRRKPIVAVKSGRSSAGMRAASSHTAAMASPDVAVDALFRQTGVIRVDTIDELFDMALVLGAQPLPAGRRVAVIGNSGGPGILVADACTASGLEVPQLAEATQTALRAIADPNAAVGNPVDLVASATPATYEKALDIVLGDPCIDAVIVISTRTFAAPPAQLAEALQVAARRTDKPMIACMLAAPGIPPLLSADPPGGIPVFETPEPAARALGRAADYAAWRRRNPGSVPDLDAFDLAQARSILDGFLASEPAGGWLPSRDVAKVLDAIGIATIPTVEARDAQRAAAAAGQLGFPVALKAAGPDLVHKSDIGGVRLGLTSKADVANAYQEMAARLGPRMTAAVVQQMAEPGVEMIVGVVHDPAFGPLVMLGMGGTATELLADRAFRILPLTDVDAAELVRSLRTAPLLFGFRGSPHLATATLESALQRVARLAGAVDALAELDINPLVVTVRGVVAVDARMRAEPSEPGPPPELRRMR